MTLDCAPFTKLQPCCWRLGAALPRDSACEVRSLPHASRPTSHELIAATLWHRSCSIYDGGSFMSSTSRMTAGIPRDVEALAQVTLPAAPGGTMTTTRESFEQELITLLTGEPLGTTADLSDL